MRSRHLALTALACAAVFAGCGSSGDSETSAPARSVTPAASTTTPDEAVDQRPDHPKRHEQPTHRHRAAEGPKSGHIEIIRTNDADQTTRIPPRPPGCPSSLNAQQCRALDQSVKNASNGSGGRNSKPECPPGVPQAVCSGAASEGEKSDENRSRPEVPSACPPAFSPSECQKLEESARNP